MSHQALVCKQLLCNAVVFLTACMDDTTSGGREWQRQPVAAYLPVEWIVDSFLKRLRYAVTSPRDEHTALPLEPPPAEGSSDEEGISPPLPSQSARTRRLVRRFSASPSVARRAADPSSSSSSTGAVGTKPSVGEPAPPPRRPASGSTVPALRLRAGKALRVLLHIVRSVSPRCPSPSANAVGVIDAAIDVDAILSTARLVVLVSGASGSGKSTLSNHLADRLQVATVCSSDHIRHLLRVFYDKKDVPVLFASTYETDQFVSPTDEAGKPRTDAQRALKGYLMQCDIVEDRLEWLVKCILERGESAVIEGVHLTSAVVEKIRLRCLQHQKSTGVNVVCVPFIVKVADQRQHIKRFASRSRNFATDPESNKYVRNIGKIRAIQRYLCTEGMRSGTQMVENDVMQQAMHRMHLSILRQMLSVQHGFTKRSSFAL